MNMDRLNYRYWEHEVWNDPKTPLVPKYTNIVDGCDPTVAIGDFEFCTGLKDKNGNLIYEGDIVIEGGCKGVVKYGTFNCSCCDGVYGWYFDGFNGQTDIRCYEFCEVIGNIHEQKGKL